MMSVEQKKGKEEKVLVAVKASREIPKAALVWALTHVVQPGDCISLLVVVPPLSSGRKLWTFPLFAGDCASTHKRSHTGTSLEQKCEISDTCSQMILQLNDVYDPSKISVKIKVVSSSSCGVVAAEAKKVQANWVVLDKDLKAEEKQCLDELHCNIVGMRRSHPKVLRLNLVGSPNELESNSDAPVENSTSIRGPPVTPCGSPEMFTATEAGTSSVSSSEVSDPNGKLRKSSESESETSPCSTGAGFRPWMAEYLRKHSQSFKNLEKASHMDKLSRLDEEQSTTDVREAMSLRRSSLPGPPPLCSVCQHKGPVFGKPPRWFSYAELERATKGFSRAKFLAEGGYGSVHMGLLPDGQAIAVKQHKPASSQGDIEFCSEVEVLSCAQHRNVVTLIGYCTEDKRRLLVYEYICNGSLDSHLYGRNRDPLEWHARQKIAVGAARGLRYLHEECRVGCIIHRDLRPNNILLTHDYEPLVCASHTDELRPRLVQVLESVGDFGLARWQPDGDTGVETRVIGTFGYLAPEYAQSGQITEKADVYSFGVVLVELLTGRKAVDLSRPKGQQCLTEWARPLLEEYAVDELIDPCLENHFLEMEVNCMVYAAALCIQRDPGLRPRMSQVLRILEGDIVMDSDYMPTPGYEGDHSGRLQVDGAQQRSCSGRMVGDDRSEACSGSFSFESVRSALWSRGRQGLSS